MPSGSRYSGRKCCAISSVMNGASQPFFFQVMMCEASEGLTTSTARILLANSWSTRWNSRSEPERSICTAMPGYCASNALPSFSPTGRSIDEYRITLPSFFAASTRSGVIDTGAGAAAITRVANAVSPSEAEPLMTSRREILFRIDASSSDLEQFLISRLDLFARLLGAFSIFLHQLDVGERLAPRMFLDLRV